MKECTHDGTRPTFQVVRLDDDHGVTEDELQLCRHCHRHAPEILVAVNVDTPDYVADAILEGDRDAYWPEYPNPYVPRSKGAADYYPPETQFCDDCGSYRQSKRYYNDGELVRGELCSCDEERLTLADDVAKATP